MELIALLLIAFQFKHFICDYPLQNAYMLGKFKPKFSEYFAPLFSHAVVHYLGTFIIAYSCLTYFGASHSSVYAFLFGLLDLVIHFAIDRIKASPKLLGRFKPDNKYFWWALGWDQMCHHLTHYLIIALIVQKLLM